MELIREDIVWALRANAQHGANRFTAFSKPVCLGELAMKFRDNLELQSIIGIALLILLLLVFTSGCTQLPTRALVPNTVSLDLGHASHITAGTAGCHTNCAEDGLTTASVMLGWHAEHVYLEVGEGYNLRGRNGGGFYGPGEVFQAHVGYTFKLK